MTDISLNKLIETGAHFGHQVKRWNPKMAEYIYGEENGVHLFDLIKTKEELETALGILKDAQKNGKKIVFLGTKKQIKEKVQDLAKSVNQYYVTERWLGGTLTNFPQMKKSLLKLRDLKAEKESGGFKGYTKKERLLIDREIDRLERFFGGLQGLNEKPDVLFIVDTKKEKGAASEARRTNIVTVGICDTNADPETVDYVIPMNDDAGKALEYVLDIIKETLLGKEKKEKTEKKETKEAKKKVKEESSEVAVK